MTDIRSRTRGRAAPAAHAVLLAALCALAVPAAAEVVFSTDFSAGIPAQLAGAGVQVEPAQGLAGLGPAGNQFGGNVLRYHTQSLHETTLTLTDLPAHSRWDGRDDSGRILAAGVYACRLEAAGARQVRLLTLVK